jgi:hypothetical protein
LLVAPIVITLSLVPIVNLTYSYKYFSFVSVYSLLLTAGAILYLRRYKIICSVFIASIAASFIFGYYWWHSEPYYPGHLGYREVADWISSNSKVGVVNCTDRTNHCFNYYWQGKGGSPGNYYYFPGLTSGTVTGIEATSNDAKLFSNIIGSYNKISIIWGRSVDNIQRKNKKKFKEIIKRKNLRSTGSDDLYGITFKTYRPSPPI